jgi:hypothetical protein
MSSATVFYWCTKEDVGKRGHEMRLEPTDEEAKSIAYHETSVLQSYREILQHFHQVTAPLRTEEMSEVK